MEILDRTRKQKDGFIKCSLSTSITIFSMLSRHTDQWYESSKTQYKEPMHYCEYQFSPFQEQAKSPALISLVLGWKDSRLPLPAFKTSFMLNGSPVLFLAKFLSVFCIPGPIVFLMSQSIPQFQREWGLQVLTNFKWQLPKLYPKLGDLMYFTIFKEATSKRSILNRILKQVLLGFFCEQRADY